MKILLDTQAFIWLINDDPKLGGKALRLVSDPSNQLLISYFSFFELTINASIGKLRYNPSITDDLPEMGIEIIMPSITALQAYTIFNPDNKDPSDNILLSIAQNEKCTVLTSDTKILATKLTGLQLLDATK